MTLKAFPTEISSTAGLNFNKLLHSIWLNRWLFFMMIPGLIYFLTFRYWPLWNAQIAFKDFKPLLGVEASPFIGFKHFVTFFKSYYFTQLITNTLILSLLKLILGMPVAIILALSIYESMYKRLARLVQTVTYLPHFLSWVIMFGILLVILSPGEGLINEVIKANGGEPIAFLTSPAWFRAILVGSDIWKETGWGTIIYLAALMAIDPTLFEAAAVDGASRLQRIWHISLPGIASTIVVVTLLRLGNILDAGFQQVFVLYSLPVYSVGDIIDTWVYRQGVLEFQFSLATAVGLFKGTIGLLLVLFANRMAKKWTGSGLY
ncbi:putative multiple-sugar transport system permease YteP [Anaerolineales bacterium]|nr:putative multiple-sugar transport system permease YteP [Anaerolineales bacterium]